MRCMLFAVLFVCLAGPAAAQLGDTSPEVDKLLVCATVFSFHGEDLSANGDTAGALEWSNRSNEIGERAAISLESEGKSATDIENTMMNYALVTGFEVGAGAARFTFEDCLSLVE